MSLDDVFDSRAAAMKNLFILKHRVVVDGATWHRIYFYESFNVLSAARKDVEKWEKVAMTPKTQHF